MVLLIGQHISYSASPSMQRAAFAALGLGHRYELADVPADELPSALARLRQPDFLGANVTVPHKTAVLGLLDEIDEVARTAGAVNTIVRRGGLLLGTNTDVPAIAGQAASLRPRPRRALILGAGGAARAVSRALGELAAGEVQMISRSAADGALSWSRLPELIAGADLLVNATPVGASSTETPVPASLLRADLAVLDLVYRPSPTRLVDEARAAGAPALAGAGVLLGQGWRSLGAWLGQPVAPAVVAVMAEALRVELGAAADV